MGSSASSWSILASVIAGRATAIDILPAMNREDSRDHPKILASRTQTAFNADCMPCTSYIDYAMENALSRFRFLRRHIVVGPSWFYALQVHSQGNPLPCQRNETGGYYDLLRLLHLACMYVQMFQITRMRTRDLERRSPCIPRLLREYPCGAKPEGLLLLRASSIL